MLDHASYFAQWFPIDSYVEVELHLPAKPAHLLCGTVVLITPIGIIVEERDGVVLAPWASIGVVRAPKEVAS